MLTDNKYLLKVNLLSFINSVLKIYNEQGELVIYAIQKAFRLKTEIICYADKKKSKTLFYIKARKIIDVTAIYDVFESGTDNIIATLRSKGLVSMGTDEWEILDAQEKVVGVVKKDLREESLIRRLLPSLFPQNYKVLIGEENVLDLNQDLSLLGYKLNIVFSKDTRGFPDKRIAFAVAIILALVKDNSFSY